MVPSSAKTSDFISPKELKDQLPITLDLLQSFCEKSIFASYASPKKFVKFVISCPTSSVENIQSGDPYLFFENVTIFAKIFKGRTL